MKVTVGREQPGGHLPRKAAILVVVLVVLTLVGLMAAQAMQTLLLMKGHDARRANLRQTDELLEFGRHALAATTEDPEDADLSFQVSVFDQTALIQVQVEDKKSENKKPSEGRVVAQFPLNSESEISASWQSKDS